MDTTLEHVETSSACLDGALQWETEAKGQIIVYCSVGACKAALAVSLVLPVGTCGRAILHSEM